MMLINRNALPFCAASSTATAAAVTKLRQRLQGHLYQLATIASSPLRLAGNERGD